MALKLHRCPFTFNKLSGHPCWRVQKALDEAGVEYEDGTMLREESADLAARIREGRLSS